MYTRAFPGGGGGLVPSTASGLMPTSWTNEAICRQVESVWEGVKDGRVEGV